MQQKNTKKDTLEMQRGLVKEIIVVVGVIFILAYFNLDPQQLWVGITVIWDNILAYFK